MSKWGDDILALRSKLQVDPHMLEKMCAEQPVLFEEVGSMHARGKFESRTAKLDLEVTEAELAKSIRKNPGEHGLVKITESAVQETIKSDKIYIGKREELINAEFKADQLAVLMTAFDQRRTMISSEIQLVVSRYYDERVSDGAAEKRIASARNPHRGD